MPFQLPNGTLIYCDRDIVAFEPGKNEVGRQLEAVAVYAGGARVPTGIPFMTVAEKDTIAEILAPYEVKRAS